MSGGTYSLTSTPNNRFLRNFLMAGLFTLRVFVRNPLRGSRRINIFHISFFWWYFLRHNFVPSQQFQVFKQFFSGNSPTNWLEMGINLSVIHLRQTWLWATMIQFNVKKSSLKIVTRQDFNIGITIRFLCMVLHYKPLLFSQ